ncbi:hypothetical protein ACFLSJ_04580 [Verrucomicrobiota bacterium]
MNYTRDSTKRFLNFPLVMLSKTITAPDATLSDIGAFCLLEYAVYCEPKAADALVQACYVASRRPGETLPPDVERILCRQDVDDITGALPECFADDDGGKFVENVGDLIETDHIELDTDEREALTRWCGLRRAAAFFGRSVLDVVELRRQHKRVQRICHEHEREFPPLCWCSVPADFAFEAEESRRDLDIFRCVAACRSLIGRHRFTGTTKAMIRCRMIGAKSGKAAEALCGNDHIRAEYERLGRRRQFDNVLTDVACRGFLSKVGMDRRIYMSTEAQSPQDLVGMVGMFKKAKRRREYRKKERAARASMEG